MAQSTLKSTLKSSIKTKNQTRFERFMRSVKEGFLGTDKLLLLLCMGLSTLSCIIMYSLCYQGFVNSWSIFYIQVIASVAGLILAVVISFIDYQTIARFWPFYMVVAILLVLLTFVIGYQPPGSDDRAWLNFGFTLFQPSELLKLAFIFSFGFHLTMVKNRVNFLSTFLGLLAHAIVPIGLIALQGDLGTMLVFVFIYVVMLIAAGLSWKLLAIAGGIIVVLAPIIWFLLPDYLQERFMVAWDPSRDPLGAGMQQYKGQIALGSGQLFGRGLFADGLYDFPARHNDMVFAYIGQTLGFVGCIAVALAITIICVKMLFIAKKSNDDMGLYICCGVFAIWLFQTILNIGMVICVLPVIGVTLPLVSYGGTSVMISYLSIGLVMSVHRQARRESMFEAHSGSSLR